MILGALLAATLASPAAAAPTDEPRGYWLGVELAEREGPGVEAALDALRASRDDYHPDLEEDVGVVVGHVSRVEDALVWVSRWAFDDPGARGSRKEDAPAPGEHLLTDHGVHLRALILTGSTPDGGRRTIQWPADPRAILPPELGWTAASLVPDRAPLFATPSHRLPPAAQRHAMARRRGALYVVDTVERCAEEAEPRCLRWVQVVSRDGDRFVPGYLPAHQVALLDAWVPSPTELPRAQLIESGHRGSSVWFLLVARGADGVLRQRALRIAAGPDGAPTPMLQVSAAGATVTFPGRAPDTLALDASLDARP